MMFALVYTRRQGASRRNPRSAHATRLAPEALLAPDANSRPPNSIKHAQQRPRLKYASNVSFYLFQLSRLVTVFTSSLPKAEICQ